MCIVSMVLSLLNVKELLSVVCMCSLCGVLGM